MQVLWNMLLHWLERPCVIIPCCMFTISVLSGLSTLTVSPFFPGIVFLVSKRYKRDEVALRLALVCCGSFFSSAF
ncbi:uncharacterized protein HD556DRAFT_1396033 [Suillus plorans]|uniref:Uncharacterized protein n=1 Tax=Suillus plorans TaxID=116603 RepID=A0A9P7DEJ7_9AGAM|nr:uncharacterized protein HD556DRAFT_1396033 [Suillus plorans]KAG1789756.1 hypothetical protein HD556DRAFT_1396033 [Suillus plorans]